MGHVLITRLAEDARAFAKILKTMDIPSTSVPLQKVQFFPILTPVEDIQALLFTSKNGIRAFCKAYPQRDFLVYCVGKGSAELAKKMGFKRVYSANGNVSNLVDLVKEGANPSGAQLLYIGGKDLRHSLEGLLPDYPIQRVIGYEIVDHFELTEHKLQAIKDPRITHVCLFSPRSGERYLKVLQKYQCEQISQNRTCVALSEEVAEAVKALPWKHVESLCYPTLEAMLEYLYNLDEKESL